MAVVVKKPFRGKRIYLDLKLYKGQEDLSKILVKLGAKIESFFSREVHLVITDREPLNQSYSPNPCNAYSSKENIVSRSIAIVQKAKQKHSGSTDLLATCRQWNIKVIHIKKALIMISNHKMERLKQNNENKVAHKMKPISANNLSFIKIEDIKRIYKPIHETFRSWRDVLDSRLYDIVVDLQQQVIRKRDRILPKSKPPNILKAIENKPRVQVPEVSEPKNYVKFKRPKPIRNYKKQKYCEICHCYFMETFRHLQTEHHSKFMKDATKFEEVHIAMQGLPTIAQFLQKNERFGNEDFGKINSEYLSALPSPVSMECSLLANEVIAPSFSSDQDSAEEFPFLKCCNNFDAENHIALPTHSILKSTELVPVHIHDLPTSMMHNHAGRIFLNSYNYLPEMENVADSDIALDLSKKSTVVQDTRNFQANNFFLTGLSQHPPLNNFQSEALPSKIILRRFPFTNFGYGWKSRAESVHTQDAAENVSEDTELY